MNIPNAKYPKSAPYKWGRLFFYKGYIRGRIFSKNAKNHKILCFFTDKTLCLVVFVVEHRGFELLTLFGIVWNCVELCGIYAQKQTLFYCFVVFCGIVWYRLRGEIRGIRGMNWGKKEKEKPY